MTIPDRPLPQNLEAEKCVLGSILLHKDAFKPAEDVLGAGDFFDERHRLIFFAMRRVHDKAAVIDLVNLKAELEFLGYLSEAGGPVYIASLVDGVPRSTPAEYYAKIVKEKSMLRNLIASANKILKDAYDADNSV